MLWLHSSFGCMPLLIPSIASALTRYFFVLIPPRIFPVFAAFGQQKYHHVGAYVCMGLLTQARSEAVWLFVLYNSFIHTIMYFYYFLTVIGIKPSWKKLITIMQLVQVREPVVLQANGWATATRPGWL